MQRRFADYRPVPRWRARLVDVQLFRSVQLNLVGWTVIAALCLTGAVLGYGGGRLLHLPDKAAAFVGFLTVLGCLVVLDRRQHARTK